MLTLFSVINMLLILAVLAFFSRALGRTADLSLCAMVFKVDFY